MSIKYVSGRVKELKVGLSNYSESKESLSVVGRISGIATNNVIPFLYSNYSDLPSATTYHGAFAHVHATQKAYYAHGGNWIELVNKETSGTVGTGTERYNIGPVDLTTLKVTGVSTYQGDLDIESSVLITGITTVSGLVDINAGGQANTFKVEDLTSGRVVYAGAGGELQDSANLTFDGTTLTASAFAGNGAALTNLTIPGISTSGTSEFANLELSGTLSVGGTSIFNSPIVGVATFSGATTFSGAIDANSGADISGGTGLTASTAKISDLTDNRIVIVGTSGELEDDSNLTFNGTQFNVGSGVTIYQATGIVSATKFHGDGSSLTGIDASALKFGGVVKAQANASGVVVTGVLTATTFKGPLEGNVTGNVTGNVNGDLTGTLQTAAQPNVTSLGTIASLTASSAKVSDLTSGRVVVAGASGELEDASTFTFSGGTVSATNFSGNLTGTLQTAAQPNVTSLGTIASLTASTAKISDLTNNRVVIVGTSGELEDTTKLTFDGSTLAIVGDATFTGNVSVAGTLTSEDKTNIDSVGLVTARTGVRVTSGGIVVSSGVVTFTDAIDSNGGANISGGSGLVASSAKVSDLTSGRVVVAGTAGELQDASTFTFSGGTVSATAFVGDGSNLTGITAAGTGAIGGLTIKDEGAVVGTAGSVSTLDFKGSYITAIATAGASGVATVTVSDTPSFTTLNVAGVSTFVGEVNIDGNILLDDPHILGFGASGEKGYIYHTGSNMMITNIVGDVHITTSDNDKDIKIQTDNGSGGLVNYFLADGSTGEAILYHYGTEKIKTSATGVTVSGTCQATDFNSTSDIRLKDNIQVIEDSLAKLVQIEGVSFNWKENNKPALGVIADQVQEILPELVTDGNPKTVNYNGLIGLLIEAVKEQQIQINELKSKLP